MINSLQNLNRIFTIYRVLAKHDALFIVEEKVLGRRLSQLIKFAAKPLTQASSKRRGVKLADALTELGPTFIKLGQALSTRPDLFDEEMIHDLTNLQDKLPAFSFAEVEKILNEDFDGGSLKLYKNIDKECVAAASIAQVHLAITREGEEVAVKVLRPGVKEAFKKDIALLKWLAKLAEKFSPNVSRLKLKDAVREFEKSVNIEMNLRLEAAAADELRHNISSHKKVKIPKIDWQRTSDRVLTLERLKGRRIDDTPGIKSMGLNSTEIVETAAHLFFHMVFENGFFHADLHPGNLFIQDDGTLAVLDFGIMGRIDSKTQKYLAEMLLGFITRDFYKVAEIHKQAGYIPQGTDINIFAQACRAITEPILNKPLGEISVARLLGQLFKVTEEFNMQTQPQLLLLQKSMLLAEGTGRLIAPQLNMWQLSKPLVEKWIQRELGVHAKLRDSIVETSSALQRLPSLITNMEKATKQIEETNLVISNHAKNKKNPSFYWWLVAVNAIIVFFLFFY